MPNPVSTEDLVPRPAPRLSPAHAPPVSLAKPATAVIIIMASNYDANSLTS